MLEDEGQEFAGVGIEKIDQITISVTNITHEYYITVLY